MLKKTVDNVEGEIVEEEKREQMHYINTLQGLMYLISARLS